jgi:hypothetical protein
MAKGCCLARAMNEFRAEQYLTGPNVTVFWCEVYRGSAYLN